MWKLIVLLLITYVVVGVVLIATMDAITPDVATNGEDLPIIILLWPVILVGVALVALYKITKMGVEKHAGRKED